MRLRLARSRTTLVRAGLTIALASVLAGCDEAHSVFHPRTTEARRVAFLGWLMIGIATAVFLLVLALLVRSFFGPPLRRRSAGGTSWIASGGIALPTTVVILLSGLTVWAMNDTRTGGGIEISAIGHQYWWEIRYPGTAAVTGNEFHIPVGRSVHLSITSTDVIHSLWVPELGPKRDMIPGHTTELTWHADEPGTFRGQCAEFCGLQHAEMALIVVADPPEVFDRWLATQAADASAPSTAVAQRGEQVFTTEPCAACHTVRGSVATGTVGPDLTHFGSRATLGAGVLSNNAEHVASWIANAQSFKPGSLMPPIDLSADEVRDLTAYLEGLR